MNLHYFSYILHSDLFALLSSTSHLINTPIDDENTTLLHLAANTTTPVILQLLLEYGADINWQNDDGLTALHVAAMWGKDVVVMLLLEGGANSLIPDSDNLTPLDHAISQGECCITSYKHIIITIEKIIVLLHCI